MGGLSPEQILRILELTDSLSLHREAILIPLKVEGDGSVTMLPDGRLRIVGPSGGSFDDWLRQLKEKLEGMDLSKIRQNSQ